MENAKNWKLQRRETSGFKLNGMVTSTRVNEADLISLQNAE